MGVVVSRDRIGRIFFSFSCIFVCINIFIFVRKVKGKWFLVALVFNESKFIAKDTDMKFFIYKI